MRLILPEVLSVDERRSKNAIRQMGERGRSVDGTIELVKQERQRGLIFRANGGAEEILLVAGATRLTTEHERVLVASVDERDATADLSEAKWLKHPRLRRNVSNADLKREVREVRTSWEGGFSYVREDPANGVIGLRGPQLGAIHAVHAHWSVSEGTATVVMPTGTGKTEAMLSILLSTGCQRVLVVVPTDVLRAQLSPKFLTLGILRSAGCTVLGPHVRYPVVCMLKHTPRTADEVDQVFLHSQVIVTTASIAGRTQETLQERMAKHCPYLFVDEAHHTEAQTWLRFKDQNDSGILDSARFSGVSRGRYSGSL